MSGSAPPVLSFGNFQLDRLRYELRREGVRVPVEPQVLALLHLLAANHERMVGKDEIIERIWNGRIVSESAVAARIKAARRAIGDDGKQQRLIRTIHGKGFRFVGAITELQAGESPNEVWSARDWTESSPSAAQAGRPSIAVLPFLLIGEAGRHAIIADALPADLIMDLSRLHWLFVIARGSSFRFRGAETDPRVVGRELGVRYCLNGSIEVSQQRVTVAVSLVDAVEGGTIWAEQYRGSLDELQEMRPEIESEVVRALEVRIPRNEVQLARRRPAAELDAWASFHLGLDHMYRFTRRDNMLAGQMFRQSLDRDPHFSRAMGGLSFTHFQNAFLNFADDPDAEAESARSFARRAVEADPLDPFAHFNLGRSFWIDGQLEDSLDWLDRATSLSPSYAQGIYNRALVGVMAGKVERAEDDLALAMALSPLDPLAYAMVASRALTLVQLGDFERAAHYGARAARMPGAHKHIELIAAFTAQLAGDDLAARDWLAKAKRADPDLSARDFFHAFPFAQTAARERIERSLIDLGLETKLA